MKFRLFVLLMLCVASPLHAAERRESPRISMDVQDIPVRVALQLIAKEAGVNVATADSVSGTVTLSLRDVPWRDALQAVVRSKALAIREHEGLIWVEPPSAAMDVGESLQTAIVPVRYHNAQVIAKSIADAKGLNAAGVASVAESSGAFLSPRGKLFADERNNVIVVSDLPVHVRSMQELIGRLDIPAKQVLIEARVVVASERFSKELGAKFGVNTTDPRQSLSGTLDGAQANMQGNLLERTLMTGFQLANPSGSAALSVLRSGAMLDVELQAMQTQGLGQIVSQPRIITTNQRTARIAQGREIGYVTLQNHDRGNPTPNVAFKEALLELEVTPTITPDGEVFLQVALKKDELDGYVQTSVGDIPQINKREVTTSVLLRDGQTLVVGGVQEFLDQNDTNKVPFLGDVPGLKHLLRKTRKQRDKAELLIFLTPSILPPEFAARSVGGDGNGSDVIHGAPIGKLNNGNVDAATPN